MDTGHRRGLGGLGVLLLLCGAVWAAPVLEVDKTEWKMGKVPRNETRSHTFTLRNTGDEDLVIGQIRPSCRSCLGKLDGDRTLRPAESRPLQVTYQAVDAHGTHTMSVTIHSNDPERPLVRLRLTVEVVPHENKPVLTVRPAAVDIGVVAVGKPTAVTVVLGNDGDAPLDLESIVASARCRTLDVSKDSIPPKGQMRIPIEVLPKSPGIIQESIGFETNDPDRPELVVPIEGYAQSAEAERPQGLLLVPRVVQQAGKPGFCQLALSNMSRWLVTVSFPETPATTNALSLVPGTQAETVVDVPTRGPARIVLHLVLEREEVASSPPP